MKLMKDVWLRCSAVFAQNARRIEHGVVVWLLAGAAIAGAQAVSTTAVQGTVYLANGQPGAGTLTISWPAFTTAAGQAVAADSTTVTIAPDGFLSVNLAPNVGATPAGEYYTAVYYMSDGSTSTQYWVVPAAAQASLAQVQAQVMPAAQAVQAVSKTYVDQSIAELTQSLLNASGGTLSGPLYLSGDPTQPLQAADKHYVDVQVATAVPLAGGNMTGALTSPAVNGVEAPSAVSGQTNLQTAMNAAGTNGAMEIPPTYAGTDTFTNPNGVKVTDLRTVVAQQTERSVKEFGAVCDGVTDDTNALQAAINYANAHGVALTIPEGTCKTRTLNWHGESIGGLGKQVSALMGFPGQDVLASGPDATNMLSYTRLHDLTIYVDQSVDASCSPAEGRAAAGSCQISRAMETNSIFSAGGNGLSGTAGTGAGWWVGNCAIAMQAATGVGGNGLKVAEIENLEIATTGVDPMAAQYPGAHSTHTCGMYLAQWPQWSEFRNIDVRGLNTGVAIPALPVTAPAGLNADSNRWQNVTIQATHALTAAAGSNNVLDNVVAMAGNSSAMAEPPTGLVLDLGGNAQGWTVRNAVVMPTWNAVQPALTVTASGGAVTAVTVGTEQGLGWDPYGTSVPVAFSGSCTAQATAAVNANGAIASVTVTQGGVGCSATTTASVNAAGTWDTAAPVNLIGGQNMTFFAGNLLKGNGGYTVWNATNSASYGTQLDGGGGTLPGGGAYAALIRNSSMGTAFQVDQFPGTDLGAKIQACVSAVNTSYGGTCDARNFTGSLSMASNLTIATGNTAVLLPCATITTANQIVVTAGTRNVALRGCALRGGTEASGSQGGTVLVYSGAGAMVQVGDPTYAADTPGFHMDNMVINTTAAASGAQGLIAYRTQEMDLESLYFLGNSNQTGMTLDGTGNYTGGTFLDDEISGFGTAVNAIGHQIANPATTDWLNASTFVRLHIDCPTSNGSPISGTYGINLQQGDGNTFTGGDVEGCATALHLGPNATDNTIVGLRNENSTNQVVADAGSAYNNWMTGGTMFTGKLTDNGTRNSFLDTFHRSFNGLNGDWYGSQQDATVTNHFRLGIGTGNERGLLNEYQTDYGYRWITGLSDATAGEQFYEIQDSLNNVGRLAIGQYNNGQSSTNNQTVINSAGTGAVVLNGSNNSGTGGVTFGSGGSNATTVATVDKAGNAQFNGTLQVGGTTQSTGTMTVRNNADAEVDYYLWPGLTTSQKGSYTYKDWNGNSQWYMVKDASNNWALNSATGGLDSFKAYQSTNSGDTYIDTSNSTGHIRLNYEAGSGAETDIYSGSSASLDAAFLGPTSIKFPGLAATSGHFCLQVDTSGYLTNTGVACGSGGASGTINSGNSGQIAYYTASGTTIGGMNAVPMTSGGTGATSASAALANLGGLSTSGGTLTGALTATAFNGPLTGNSIPVTSPYEDIRAYGAVIDGSTPIDTALQNAINACPGWEDSSPSGNSCTVLLPCGGAGCYLQNGSSFTNATGSTLQIKLQGALKLGSTFVMPDSTSLIGDGGGQYQSFQSQGPTANVNGPNVYGSMGTAITSTGTAVNFTPAFSAGSIANMPVNSAITIAGTMSCTGTATRTASSESIPYPANVTFTATSCVDSSGNSTTLRIPAGALVTISGCSDSSFDLTGVPVISSNYPTQTAIWPQEGTASTATGCTITGFNDNTFETVRITAVSGSTATAVFAHTHGAADQWGMVAIAPPINTYGHHDIENIDVSGNVGVGFWGQHLASVSLINDGFAGNENMTSLGVEFAGTAYATIANSSLGVSIAKNCASNCSQPSYPYGMRCTSDINNPQDGGCGGHFTVISNSWIMGGIKVDNNGINDGSAPPTVRDVLIETPTANGITIDPRGNSVGNFEIDSMFLQDDFLGNTPCHVGLTDPGGAGSFFSLKNPGTPISNCVVNNLYEGTFTVDNARGMSLALGRGAPVGTYTDGGANLTEIRGVGAGLAPSVVPFPLLPTIALSGCSGCTITTGKLFEDGTSSAIEIDTTSGGSSEVYAGNTPLATYPGDHFLLWSWVRPGANQTYLGSVAGSNVPFGIQTWGGETFNPTTPGGFGMTLQSDWWHPQVALLDVVTGNSTPHYVAYFLYGGPSAGQGNQFANWGWAFIPGPNNPNYAGVTIDMLEQARQELYHGAIPVNYAGGGTGHAVTTEPIDAPGFNIVNLSTGTVSPLSPLATATPTGVVYGNGSSAPTAATSAQIVSAIGSTAVTNATNFTGSLSGDVTGTQTATSVGKINGGSMPTSATVLGTNSSGQPVAAGTTGSGNVVLASGPTLSAPTISGTLAGASETLSGTLSVTGTQTLTGATTMQANVTLENGANSNQTLAIQPGASADETGAVQFNNYSGTGEWQLRKDGSNYLRLTDVANSLDRGVFYQNGNTIINSGAGANAVVINNTSGSGTGGFAVYEGGSNNSTTAFQVTGSGNTTATGFLQGKFMMGSGTMTLATGAAAGTSPSIACATSHVCDGVSGTVTLTTGTSPTTGTLATLSFPSTHTNYGNCIVSVASATAVITSNTWTESTTAVTITANTALSASTAYTVKYWCGGN